MNRFNEEREIIIHNSEDSTTHMIYQFHCEECHHEFATEPCVHFDHNTHPWMPLLCYTAEYLDDLPPLVSEK